jgi:hypothetical protein
LLQIAEGEAEKKQAIPITQLQIINMQGIDP